MKKLKCILCMALSILMFGLASCGDISDDTGNAIEKDNNMEKPDLSYEINAKNTINATSATDSLVRFYETIDAEDTGKYVGIFYFLWIGQHGSANQDISKLTLEEIESSSNIGVSHYWEEPLYDYYDSGDPWVFRKHLELLTFAGIDYICFDATNNNYYGEVLKNLLPVALELSEAGWNIPKFMFYTNTASASTINGIYSQYYDEKTENGKNYSSLWFKGKDNGNLNSENNPWIIGDKSDYEANCSEEIKNFFYFKDSQWPNSPDKDVAFPWMSWTNSDGNYQQHNHNGIMSVSIAQHLTGAFSDTVLYNNRKLNKGRGFSISDGLNDESRVNAGSNFQDQWDYAFSQGDEISNIFITGWNEWIAQKQPVGNGRETSYFVDQFNMEFSRDAEMMKGGYGDNYYLQIIQNVRAFKGITDNSLKASSSVSVPIDMNVFSKDQWKGTMGYMDMKGDTIARNYKSANYSLGNYLNNTGRNDIIETRVSYDTSNLYFYVECAEDITPYASYDKCWMNILIEVDGSTDSDWQNYNYVINRTVNGNETVVQKLKSDGTGVNYSKGEIKLNGNVMLVKIPRKALKIDNGDFTIRFKVADNVTNYTDITDYYVNGDSAPIGRINYTYRTK